MQLSLIRASTSGPTVQDNRKLRVMVEDTEAISSELRLQITALKTQAAAAADEQLHELKGRLADKTERLAETEQELEASATELAETKDKLTAMTAKYDALKQWQGRQRDLQQRENQLLQRESVALQREKELQQREQEQELPCPQSVMPGRTQARTSPQM